MGLSVAKVPLEDARCCWVVERGWERGTAAAEGERAALFFFRREYLSVSDSASSKRGLT